MATQTMKSSQIKIQEPKADTQNTYRQQDNTSTVQISSPQPPQVPENSEYSHFSIRHAGYLLRSQKNYGTPVKAKKTPEKQEQVNKPIPATLQLALALKIYK